MLLLLAGTAEARIVAERLAEMDIPAIASLAGATKDPADLAIPTRSGGFGGGDAFEAFLDAKPITAILDATHPFAQSITRRTAKIAKRRDLPYLQLVRPEWRAEPGDNWTHIEHEEDAAKHVPAAATVFLATGRQSFRHFENLADRRLICRQIDPPDAPFPYPNGSFLIGRPPFSHVDEVALFKRLSIDWLVVKNAGGVASRTKLTAARELAIPVAMIARPASTVGARVETAGQAIDWVRGLSW
ncbi:MAG: cobalt-precorrin-6A reductase [Paracoccaceae bacterium]